MINSQYSSSEILHQLGMLKSFKDVSEIFGIETSLIVNLFFNSDKWKALKRRIKYRCSMFSVSHDIAEDAVSEYALKLIEERNIHQTIDQFVIDFMRSSRVYNSRQRSKVVYTNNITQFDKTGYTEEVFKIEGIADREQKAVLELYCRYGMSLIDISKILSVTNAEVGRIIKGEGAKRNNRIGQLEKDISKAKSKISKLESIIKATKPPQLPLDVKSLKLSISDATNIGTMKEIQKNIVKRMTTSLTQRETAKILNVSERWVRSIVRDIRIKSENA